MSVRNTEPTVRTNEGKYGGGATSVVMACLE